MKMVGEKSETQGSDDLSCTTKKMNKNALELYLKMKYGNKIGKPRNKARSVFSREFRDYERENEWANLKDTRADYWWRR